MLKLVIKPGEKIYIGRSTLLIRADTTVTVYINGDQPVLKDREAIDPQTAVTPVDQLHLLLQDMYLHGQATHHMVRYRELTQIVEKQSADSANLVKTIERWLIEDNHYMAIRALARFTQHQKRTGSMNIIAEEIDRSDL
ncbi:flagellar biosynthesis repressor FlbT [Pelagibacterium sp. 26DY04]|uniref:flagellar biosynthesis repressor FlbT n=1 Tax=Pelagibacterium sp. 26DY04 TaxID=2967130 RepID=UPI00281523C6|nr:flagellar biosynthesis repressor FlbT [Pelagibacterium sp. 26DY04]WMT86217.1 flagellar biosynthesis repressor FlbT [Pelagibacterium sp. 26DY04]